MNNTLFQAFHWYSRGDGQFWNDCAAKAAHWKHLGLTHVYLPPAYKSGFGASEPGYAVYDLFDLGQFNQKGTIRTKYGTRKQYLECIRSMHQQNLQVIADVVLNHKLGGDEKETFPVKQVNSEHRVEFASEELQIEAFTKYTFPGRKGKYSEFIWDWKTFTGVDEMDNGEMKIYKILNGYGENWEDLLDDQYGNFDYLMGADIEFRNEHVRAELKWWGQWYYKLTKVDGFRLDAVKHISPYFLMEWIDFMQEQAKKPLLIISEYWRRDLDYLINFYEAMGGRTQLFDAPLHYNFHEASMQGKDYDLRTIFDGSFVQQRPMASITFVENHDTQPLQALESTVDYWFKPIAYALILLRVDGIPCVFDVCLNGAQYSDNRMGQEYFIDLQPVPALDRLIWARSALAYGEQQDYFDHPNTIGWTRAGSDDFPGSGMAVIATNGVWGTKHMQVGPRHANQVFVDITGNRQEEITLDEQGAAEFLVNDGSVSVWVNKEVFAARQ